MNNNLIGEDFSNMIKELIPEAKPASGGKELVVRCRYCPDSTDPSHGHMYIHVPQDENDVPTFHCFKCQTSGILNSRTLINWGLYNPQFASSLDKIVNNSNKSTVRNGNKFNQKTIFKLKNIVYNVDLANQKLEYIKSRIGISLSIEECLRQKIILNMKEVVDYNRVSQYTRNPMIVQQLNDYFVGFLSLDNNFINLRKICNDGIVSSYIDKRYIVYNINNIMDNTEKMYVMPASIDLSIPRKVNIHIAEGPFDILSIRYNLRYNETTNSIFAAITGSGYKGLVLHLINTYKIFYFDLHIYPDNDQFGSDRNMEEIKWLIAPYGAKLYIHRNVSNGEKDFGVTPDRINESIYLL